ncbi:MAG: 16S rRNA (cytosine(1402)-N(4))-methyltransferase [Chloroflexi bacterium]|nr:MAG: 16S rRNA (cytosine(1402)-N(4))-methyltransferase [Chloroflexota bacterium]
MMEIHHRPVMLEETIEALQVQPGGRYIDCTVGEGGHAAAILEASAPGGLLLGLDVDPEAIEIARARLKKFGKNCFLVQENFRHLEEICQRYNFHPVHGVLFDLGVSSLQLEREGRGFSFQREAPLDMRFDPREPLTAEDIVNRLPEEELALILQKYGEERHSHRIARCIVRNRPIKTTLQLAELVSRAVDGKRGRIHPATRTFQALRIAVNHELENLSLALKAAVNVLGPGGRLVVISFHSLEDRLVKNFMRQEKGLQVVHKKVLRPSPEEVQRNPRSRSARLRVAERLGQVGSN